MCVVGELFGSKPCQAKCKWERCPPKCCSDVRNGDGDVTSTLLRSNRALPLPPTASLFLRLLIAAPHSFPLSAFVLRFYFTASPPPRLPFCSISVPGGRAPGAPVGRELRHCPRDFIALINMAANANSLRRVMTVIAPPATPQHRGGRRRGALRLAMPCRHYPIYGMSIHLAARRRRRASTRHFAHDVRTCQIRREYPALPTAHSSLSLSPPLDPSRGE